MRAELEKAKEYVCHPLDKISSINDMHKRIIQTKDIVGMYKIGMESYTRFGTEAINIVHKYEREVFLDLKFHDIPRTVYEASKAATEKGVYMFNVHSLGSQKMMEYAVKGADDGASEYNVRKPKVIGVTLLTSMDELSIIDTFGSLIKENNAFKSYLKNELPKDEFSNLLREHEYSGIVSDFVNHLTGKVMAAGLDGIVCSAADLPDLDSKYDSLMKVTPGIKGVISDAGEDQKRVSSPGIAKKKGSDILVIGTAISGADDPIVAGYEILEDIAKYME